MGTGYLHHLFVLYRFGFLFVTPVRMLVYSSSLQVQTFHLTGKRLLRCRELRKHRGLRKCLKSMKLRKLQGSQDYDTQQTMAGKKTFNGAACRLVWEPQGCSGLELLPMLGLAVL